MKKNVVIILTLFLAFGFVQAKPYTTPDRVISVYKTPAAPVIDAVEDSLWADVIAYAVTQVDSNGVASVPESSDDYAGWFKVMWDDTNVYFFFGVVDDIIYTDETGDNDKVELFFDADASGGVTQEEYETDFATDFGAWGAWWIPQHDGHTQTFDENCSQWVMEVDGETLATGTQGPGLSWNGDRFPLEGIQTSVKLNEDEAGYTMEIAIPWTCLNADVPMEDGDQVGLNIQINDFDMPGQRGFYDWIMDFSNASWCDPTVFGKMILSSSAPYEGFMMSVPQAGVAPTIDGLMDKVWQYTMPRAVLSGDASTTFWPLEGSMDYVGFFRTLWDNTNVYFFFEVMDDIIYVDETGDNDKVELFFDADASGGITQEEYETDFATDFGPWGSWWIPQHDGHTQTYDENCSQWVMEADWVNVTTGTQGPGLSWNGDRFPLDGIQGVVHINEDEAGYTVEIAMPWESLNANVPMNVGDLVGMNIQVNDFDMPSERAFYDWRNRWSNASWCDPTAFGFMRLTDLAVLSGGTYVKPDPSITVQTLSLMQNYPNPFNPTTRIEFNVEKQGLVNLAVYNINGELVATLVNKILNPGLQTMTFDGAGLSSGVYFYKLTMGDQVISKKMTLMK
jgi:hypothetical protein